MGMLPVADLLGVPRWLSAIDQSGDWAHAAGDAAIPEGKKDVKMEASTPAKTKADLQAGKANW